MKVSHQLLKEATNLNFAGNIEGHENVFFAIPGDAGYTLGPLCAEVIVDLIDNKMNNFYNSKFSPKRFLDNHKTMVLEN